jgi:hypothetical protein
MEASRKHSEGKADLELHAQVSGTEFMDAKSHAVIADHQAEQNLTLKQCFRQHPRVVWWCFYWSIAAIGWYDPRPFHSAVSNDRVL